MAEALLKPEAALAVALLLTAVAALESTVLRWSPFLLVYAAAIPIPPLMLGSVSLGPIGPAFSERPGAVAGIAASVLAWESLVAGRLYEGRVLAAAGRAGSPRWSPAAALEALLGAVRARTGWSRARIDAVYGAYFLLWAPVAEELFYWGYLYPALRSDWPPAGAALAVSVLFGVRHALHFLFLPRPYPWPAALAFAATVGVSGLLNSWLLEVSGSLWPCIALHFASNALAACLGPARGDRRLPIQFLTFSIPRPRRDPGLPPGPPEA